MPSLLDRLWLNLISGGKFFDSCEKQRSDRQLFTNADGTMEISFGPANQDILWGKAKNLSDKEKLWLPLLAVQTDFIRVSICTRDDNDQFQLDALNRAALDSIEEIATVAFPSIIYSAKDDRFSTSILREELGAEMPGMAGPVFGDPEPLSFSHYAAAVDDADNSRVRSIFTADEPEPEVVAQPAANTHMLRAASLAAYCSLSILPQAAAAGQFDAISAIFISVF